MKGFGFGLILVLFVIISGIFVVKYRMIPYTPGELLRAGLVSGGDYNRLNQLEKKFCEVCNNETSQEWQENKKLEPITAARDKILDRYGLRGRSFIFPESNFSWVCNYDDFSGPRCQTR